MKYIIDTETGTVERYIEPIKIDSEKTGWKKWDKFFYVLPNGMVGEGYINLNDDGKMKIGNMFRTEEEAEFMVERLKVITELKEFAEAEETVFDKSQLHYCISLDICKNEITFRVQGKSLFGVPTFESDTKAREAVLTVGEERVKKYYFGVKE